MGQVICPQKIVALVVDYIVAIAAYLQFLAAENILFSQRKG
jgi:hypothetical protein